MVLKIRRVFKFSYPAFHSGVWHGKISYDDIAKVEEPQMTGIFPAAAANVAAVKISSRANINNEAVSCGLHKRFMAFTLFNVQNSVAML